MRRPSWTAREIGVVSPARAMAVRALADWPELARVLVAERAFLRRAVMHLAALGIDQFLDLGAGLPTVGSLGDVRAAARRTAPSARVVAVDLDPATVASARTVVGDDPHAAVVRADALDADAVLADPAVRRLLDLNRPVGVLVVAWLHVVDDRADPAGALRRYRDALAPGSHLVLTHAGTIPGDDSLYRRTGTPLRPRSRGEVAGLFARSGFEVLEPGVVAPDRWPDGPADGCPGQRPTAHAAVGRRV